jgi:hypothetical protein
MAADKLKDLFIFKNSSHFSGNDDFSSEDEAKEIEKRRAAREKLLKVRSLFFFLFFTLKLTSQKLLEYWL